MLAWKVTGRVVPLPLARAPIRAKGRAAVFNTFRWKVQTMVEPASPLMAASTCPGCMGTVSISSERSVEIDLMSCSTIGSNVEKKDSCHELLAWSRTLDFKNK
jgi:hypothetical protein